jgi:hypothetical protein
MMLGKPRHKDWPRVSKDFLFGKVCYACGGRFRLVAHHIVPVHEDSSLELVTANLIPLCEGRYSCNCHLTWGHLGNWTLKNEDVLSMALDYQMRYNRARSK